MEEDADFAYAFPSYEEADETAGKPVADAWEEIYAVESGRDRSSVLQMLAKIHQRAESRGLSQPGLVRRPS